MYSFDGVLRQAYKDKNIMLFEMKKIFINRY